VPTLYNLKEKRAIAKLDSIVLKIIEQRRKSKEQHFDLLGMLMDVQDEDTGERMNDKQVRDEVMTLFLAGHETTALALTWLWFCLHHNPYAEEKAYQEAKQVLSGRTPEFSDLMKLDYTRQVVEETMRLYPPAWMVGRKALEDDEIGGYHIPKGYSVLMPAFYVHRNPQLWDNPEQFNPARFEKEQVKKRDRFAYFPFGGGQRLCVGNNFAMMEMQLAVAMLIQKFHFRLVDGKPVLDPLITLRPKGGMMMEVERR
jgi:cytochrome P450